MAPGTCAGLRLLVGRRWEWLPVTGASGEPDTYVLPVLALAALSTGYVALITRAELVEALRAPYVEAARGRGLGDRRVVAVHALRPSLTSVVTFLMPGLGGAFIGAIADRDRALAARARGRRDGARHRRQRGGRRPRGRARPADPVGRCDVTS